MDEQPSEVNGFDIERSTAESWASFSVRLSDVLSVMEPGATLTIGAVASEHPGTEPFVTFRCAPGGRLLAEASGNAELGAFFKLSDAAAAALAQIGWAAPTPDGPAPDRFTVAGTQDDPHPLADAAVAALRDVFGVPHPAFLEPDQLAEILTPPAVVEQAAPVPPTFAPAELIAQVPATREQLEGLIATELAAVLGHPPVRDADGDFGIRVGSTMVFVRASTDAREVLVFAPIVHDVEGRSRAMEVLSDLNTDARFVRFLLLRDRVFVSLSVYGQPFVGAHLRQALELVSLTADAIDNDLATKLRGRTTFTDEH